MTIAQKDYENALALLTGAGSPFELRVEDVGGFPMRNFANRLRSMREMVAQAAERGDAEFIIHGDRRVTYAELDDQVR